MAAANNPFGAPSAPAVNPFAKPIQAAQPAQTASVFGSSSAPNQNPFGKTIFGQAQSSVPSASPSPFAQNPFAKPGGLTNSAGGNKSPFFGAQTTTQQATGFGAANANAMKGPQGLGGGKPFSPSNGYGNSQASQMFGKGKATPQRPQQSGGRDAGATLANKFQRGQRKNNERPAKNQPGATRAVGFKSTSGAPTREPTERTRELSEFAYNFHNRINDQLKKDNLKPPQWPTPELGNPNKRDDVENLKQSFKKYRTRVYDALRKVELIDDPEKRRKLEDALPFKGICEDMCPEFEKISRIAEFDVKNEEKKTQPGGLTAWPEPSKMVKKFGRSAAGQDAPLPMDVRSIDALRRTTDYLFNDLLQSENNLPSMHNYLWDRTRAVRKDFTFHSQKSAEEMKDMVYCFETITRFHATALHLLSRKGFANEDFEQKQEIEQLGRTILSLMEAYDVCKEKHVLCENEAEFRAYYLLLNAHDPSIAQRIRTWGKEYWFDSEEIQTALSLIQAMEDLRESKGPIKPRRMTTMSDTAFANFFAIVENPRVSYTMACVAEVHFTFVRQCILKNLVRAYARQRDAPRTITASDLNQMLRFDTPEEAVAFAEEHNFEFTTWVPTGKPAVPDPYLLINNKRKHVPSPRVPQSYSGLLVERKRAGQSLPYVIYNTIYEDVAESSSPGRDSDANGDSLFVSPQQALPAFPVSQANKTRDVASSSPFTSMFGAAPPTTKAPENTPMFQTAVKDFGALNHPLTGNATTDSPQATGATTSSPFSRPSPAQQPQGAASPFSMFGQPSTVSPATQTSSAAPALAPKPASVFAPVSQTPQPTFSFGQPQAANPSPSSLVPTAPAVNTLKPITSNSPAPTTSVFSSGSAPANPFASISNQVTSSPPAKSPETTQQPSSGFTFAPTAPSPKSLISFASTAGTEQQASTPAGPTQTQLPGTPSVKTTIPSIFSAPPKPAESTAPAPPATQPSTLFAPQAAFNPPFGVEGRSNDGSTSSLFSTAPLSQPSQSTFAPSQPAPPPRDLMGDFAKWFVMGDGGVLEEFTANYLQELVESAFNQHLKEEAERRRREEDEQSWREARAHMKDRLQLKYFYLWREAARKLAQRRILHEGKEKMRLYREQEERARKKKKQDEEMLREQERLESKRRIQADGSRLKQLAMNASRVGRSQKQVEEELLASGIFSGARDERAAVRRALKEVAANGDWGSPQPGKTYGYGSEAGFELERAPSTASRRHDARSLRGSMAGSPESTASKEGGKTRALREKFGLGGPRGSFSSVGGSSVQSSMITKFRHSLNGIGANGGNSMIKRASNFSTPRKRSIEPSPATEGRVPKQPRRSMLGMSMPNTSLPNISLRQGTGADSPKPNGFKTSHWDLRARGLVPMPDGQWLPEAIASAIKEGKLKPPSPPTRNHSYSPAIRPSTEHAILSDDDESMGMGSTYNDNGDDVEVDDSASMTSWRLRVARLTGSTNPIQQRPQIPKQPPADYSTSSRLAKLKARMGYGSPSASGQGSPAVVRPSPTPSGASTTARPFSRREASWSAILDRKRKRDLASEAEASPAAQRVQRPENSPPLAKKAYYAASAVSRGSTAALSTREETNAAVEETQRMLRELRETMDKLDSDKAVWREEVGGGKS
ncbi:SAC3/GANP/Nin1/mts3/eIF-3 p25 family-domain-containing protein [Pseudoneurospora amorphoporcata]|uniref:SAC3/GANP/Nin1/mts3/eIF-3 p25 family-domain-containing protein n=1 Tax=Pseudoneurospora amorphoporcata TaxID=241081 RepID=A0AAN6NVG0_9PEZI|nr:SAC3/GANP/Nin1/mts3/eIF-3 p25 family-domain-containing protein [Pseudoneurospora amorphoporcata]